PAPPTATQTAWALRALVATRAPGDAITRGARFLVEAQRPDGGWEDAAYVGTAFPGAHPVRPTSWAPSYALLALAELAAR
ncbi:squalene--hopene cyclase, partial [Myxococcota bacterium]|nr:squalene--hopene cyclase [Myxococcota bacterium]